MTHTETVCGKVTVAFIASQMKCSFTPCTHKTGLQPLSSSLTDGETISIVQHLLISTEPGAF